MPSSASSRVARAYDAFKDARPDIDAHLLFPYDAKNLKDKRLNTDELRTAADLPTVKGRRPLVVVLADLVNDAASLMQILPAFRTLAADLVVVGDAPADLPNVRAIPADETSLHRGLAAADILLFPGAPTKKALAHTLALRYGSVPVIDRASALHGAADDYDPAHEMGNAFLYEPGDVWSMHAALVRAVETFKLPYDWKAIQANGFEDQWA